MSVNLIKSISLPERHFFFFNLTCILLKNKLLSISNLLSCIIIDRSPLKGKRRTKDFTLELNSLLTEHWGCDTAARETLLALSQASFLFDYIPMGCLGSLNTIQDFKAKEGSARGSTTKIHN